jgi:hypothetical protein
LSCCVYALRAEGQLDLILALLAELSYAKHSGDLNREEISGASKVTLIGMKLMKNQVKKALENSNQKEFETIVKCLDKAITYTERNEFYAAGDTLAKLAAEPGFIVQRALKTLAEYQRV